MSVKTPTMPPNKDSSETSWMAGDTTDALTGHEYDGIQEYDNPLPGWWKWLFVGTIVWSVPYFAYYHFGAPGRSVEAQYEVAAAENMRKQFAEIGELRPDAPTIVKFANDERWVAFGQSIYKSHCVACHGPEGAGVVGPNLTDEHYKNVRNVEDILKVINVGAGAGAMPAWQARLEENERILVSSYVASLRGKNAAGGKAPEGQLIPPWPTVDELQATEPSEDAATANNPATAADGAEPAGEEATPAADDTQL